MREISGMVHIDAETRLVGLFGWPIEHSVSPPMQNAAFAALDMNWCYLPFKVRPADLESALRGLTALGIQGVNVTVPHKQRTLAFMHHLTPAARAIGAVNTVAIRDGHLLGHNTDAEGFLRAVRDAGLDPKDSRALLIGAGGAARAVAYALLNVGCEVCILNRTPERAEALAEELGEAMGEAPAQAGTLSSAALERELPGRDLVVNATSLGMWPDVDASPLPNDVDLPGAALYFDLVYNPQSTLFMQQGSLARGSVANGLRMLVHQGAASFEVWTGEKPPVSVMYQACLEALESEE